MYRVLEMMHYPCLHLLLLVDQGQNYPSAMFMTDSHFLV